MRYRLRHPATEAWVEKGVAACQLLSTMTSLHDLSSLGGNRRQDVVAVAPMRLLERVITLTGATHLVSVLNAHLMPATPASIEPSRHLKLAVSDHAEADGGSRHPWADSIERLLEFAEAWDRQRPLFIHCFSGLNRSTAAAYVVLCGLNPRTPETLIAHHLRQASDTAAPNRIMVAVGDQLLGRGGRMASALDVIGSGSPAAEGKPFILSTAFDSQSGGAQRPSTLIHRDIALD